MVSVHDEHLVGAELDVLRELNRRLAGMQSKRGYANTINSEECNVLLKCKANMAMSTLTINSKE